MIIYNYVKARYVIIYNYVWASLGDNIQLCMGKLM